MEIATDPTQFQDSWLDKLWDKSAGSMKGLRKSLATRRLDAQLNDVMNYARALKINNAKPGDPRYKSLDQKVSSLLEAYCQKWECTSDSVYARWPGLTSISEMANPPQPKPVGRGGVIKISIGAILGLVVLSAVLGFVYSLISHSFHWGAHFIR